MWKNELTIFVMTLFLLLLELKLNILHEEKIYLQKKKRKNQKLKTNFFMTNINLERLFLIKIKELLEKWKQLIVKEKSEVVWELQKQLLQQVFLLGQLLEVSLLVWQMFLLHFLVVQVRWLLVWCLSSGNQKSAKSVRLEMFQMQN